MNVLILLLAAVASADRPNLVVADFEGDDYTGWAVAGTAFGKGPARGTLPGQMSVEGFEGRGLVNSFNGGDDATGTLTSPPFQIQRTHLNFLIGGGKYPGETCLDLLVGGSVVRTATGPNDRPGGSERLDWASWDVAEFEGKEAVLRVVDHRKGGWGHINVDQITQGDRPRGLVPASREMVVDARYLHLPVCQDAPNRRVRVEADGKYVDEFDIKLADGRPDFVVFRDLAPQKGARLKMSATLPVESKALDGLTLADDVPDAAGMYRERLRPQFHFTSRRGWLNDPNGLVYFEGEYHLFYQHNPYGWDWGNMHWGHAVSRDLVRWTELPEALTPRRYGDWCFSGSAVVDHANTSGFGKDGRPPLVLAYTSTGRGECIAFSNDRGRTWTEFEGNPVVKHEGRDPRLFWHDGARRWVMAVYDEGGGKRAIAFYSSPDLKAWTYESEIGGFFECPDLFPLRDPSSRGAIWVLSGADGEYLLGDFDGRTFTPKGGKKRVWHGDFYAAQTFNLGDLIPPTAPFSAASGGPPGRVQVGWGRDITFPGMPFNQQMTIPCQLSLKEFGGDVRLLAEPGDVTAPLREASRRWSNADFPSGKDPIPGVEVDANEIDLQAKLGHEDSLTLTVRGTPIVYDGRRRTITCGKVSAPLPMPREPSRMARLHMARLHVLVDRRSIEVFADDGLVAISLGVDFPEGDRSLKVETTGGGVIQSLEVHRLKSAWK